ncbi:MAG TPA: hypothetical protein PKJ17_10335, partial [Syntrophorhabdaceae bacterium]|nr:hypothetical protein [Syntrophorhabdaceae bacterium]
MTTAISSANTSLRQVAATFKNKYFTPGDRNLDIGGGRFDYGTRFLGEKGVENLVFDPYNRSPEHNRAIIERLRGGERFPTVTVNNVLNVIAEQDVRENVVLQAAKSLEDGGTAYFLIHEGDGGGQGRKTSKGWQNNRKAEQYMAEVETHFSAVERKGNLILAKGPVNIEGPAAWDASPDTADRTFFQDSIDTDYLAAVEAGDMETAQRMVDEAAKEAGYGIGPVYHGTNAKFNTFDKDNVGTNYGKETPDHIGFFFTNRKEGDYPGGTAKDWARQSVEKKGGTSVVVGAYLKINNPFTISDYAASIGDDIDTIMTYAGDRQPVVDIFDNDSQYILNKAMEMGKDGIVFVDAFEGDSDGLYVAFEPEQIKSADPVVKDNKGNIIPLSERFNSKKSDIRYQKRGRKQQHRGSITLQREWGAQEETVLTLTPNADKSTFLHEIGHLFLWDLEQLE